MSLRETQPTEDDDTLERKEEERGPRFALVESAGIDGINPIAVEVEVKLIHSETDSFSLGGLAGRETKEAKDRVHSALSSNGFDMPSGKIVVNLSPAGVGKRWTGYDLPIAMGILEASGQHTEDQGKETMMIGELSLDGRVKHVTGVLSAALLAKLNGTSRLIVPAADFEEASMVNLIRPDLNVDILGVETLHDVVEKNYKKQAVVYESPQLLESMTAKPIDFADIKGHESIKQALEVAVAGGHNVVMFGVKGGGKTILAKALEGILPQLTDDELLEVIQIHSLKGESLHHLMATKKRPFRSPHYDMSVVGMTGSADGPGTLSLAHLGLLFMDEFPHFNKRVLEALRTPLSDGVIEVSRKDGSYKYPAKTMVVAAMNPCECGNHGSATPCSCAPNDVIKYQRRVSEPILDRLDMVLEIPAVNFDQLGENRRGEPSAVILERVEKAREMQRKRFANELGIRTNGNMTLANIAQYCQLDEKTTREFRELTVPLNLSPRVIHSTIKIARTIADLKGEDRINITHIRQAVGWRQRLVTR